MKWLVRIRREVTLSHPSVSVPSIFRLFSILTIFLHNQKNRLSLVIKEFIIQKYGICNFAWSAVTTPIEIHNHIEFESNSAALAKKQVVCVVDGTRIYSRRKTRWSFLYEKPIHLLKYNISYTKHFCIRNRYLKIRNCVLSVGMDLFYPYRISHSID